MGMVAILVMWPWQFVNIFIPSAPGNFCKKFGYIWTSGFWGYVWDCHTMRVLGQRSNNDLDRFYSQIFMYSLRQLYLPIFRPEYSKLSMKSYEFAFSHIWPRRKKGQGQSTKFEGHQSICSGEDDFIGFYHIWAWRHLGHVTQLICINFYLHLPISFHMIFGSKWPKGFPEKQVLILKSEWPLAKVK